MENIVLEQLKKAIKSRNVKYLLAHKQDVIDNIRNIDVRKLPEALRGDIDIMTAAILDGEVYVVEDLRNILGAVSRDLKTNFQFRRMVRHFLGIFQEEEKKYDEGYELMQQTLEEEEKKADQEKRKQYPEFYNENPADDQEIVRAMMAGNVEFLIANKERLIKCFGNPRIGINQIPVELYGDFDVMISALINSKWENSYSDITEFVDSATEELKKRPEYSRIVSDIISHLDEKMRSGILKLISWSDQATSAKKKRIDAEKLKYKDMLKGEATVHAGQEGEGR